MKETSRRHYSYTVYADPATALTFDDQRFGGPIGEIVAAGQARTLAGFVGDIAGRRVLDVGTGTGRAALLLAGQGALVTGIDASDEMLRVARKRASEQGLSVTFQNGDAHQIEFGDRSFDVSISLRVLMHTPEWRRAIAELCRVSDNLVILDYPSARSLAAFQSVARRVLHALGVKNEPYRVFTDQQIADVLTGQGFRIRSRSRQFVLPIGLHRVIGSRRFTTAIESFLERAGFLPILGTPVTLVAERCASS